MPKHYIKNELIIKDSSDDEEQPTFRDVIHIYGEDGGGKPAAKKVRKEEEEKKENNNKNNNNSNNNNVNINIVTTTNHPGNPAATNYNGLFLGRLVAVQQHKERMRRNIIQQEKRCQTQGDDESSKVQSFSKCRQYRRLSSSG